MTPPGYDHDGGIGTSSVYNDAISRYLALSELGSNRHTYAKKLV